MLFFPYDNAKCTKTEQDFRTCNILQTAPHTCKGVRWPPHVLGFGRLELVVKLGRNTVQEMVAFYIKIYLFILQVTLSSNLEHVYKINKHKSVFCSITLLSLVISTL